MTRVGASILAKTKSPLSLPRDREVSATSELSSVRHSGTYKSDPSAIDEAIDLPVVGRRSDRNSRVKRNSLTSQGSPFDRIFHLVLQMTTNESFSGSLTGIDEVFIRSCIGDCSKRSSVMCESFRDLPMHVKPDPFVERLCSINPLWAI
jgi:hypothetical protein